MLKKNKPLVDHFKTKYGIAETDSDKVMEKVLLLIQEDADINFDVLVNEQLLEFYSLQPQQSTLAGQFFILEKEPNDKSRAPPEISFGDHRNL